MFSTIDVLRERTLNVAIKEELFGKFQKLVVEFEFKLSNRIALSH